jgi:hypothetical protein
VRAFIREYAMVGYLGGALGAFGSLYWDDWRFYAVMVPVVLLDGWRKGRP